MAPLSQEKEPPANPGRFKLLAPDTKTDRIIKFGDPPSIELPKSVPEDVWGAKAQKSRKPSGSNEQGSFDL